MGGTYCPSFPESYQVSRSEYPAILAVIARRPKDSNSGQSSKNIYMILIKISQEVLFDKEDLVAHDKMS